MAYGYGNYYNSAVNYKIEQQEENTLPVLESFLCDYIFKGVDTTITRTGAGSRYDADLMADGNFIAIEAKQRANKYYPTTYTSNAYMLNNTKLSWLTDGNLSERYGYIYINWWNDNTIASLIVDKYGKLNGDNAGMFEGIPTIDKTGKCKMLAQNEQNQYGVSWQYFYVKKTQYDISSENRRELKVLIPKSLYTFWKYDNQSKTYSKIIL